MRSGVVHILDVGGCNLLAVRSSFENLGLDVKVVTTICDPNKIERLCIPGAASASVIMNRLRLSGVDSQLRAVVTNGIPILGICAGFQIMFTELFEGEMVKGLGVFKGQVKHNGDGLHVGWKKVGKLGEMYFLHNYSCVPEQTMDCEYWVTHKKHLILAGVQHGNIFGCQFHPEKSGSAGAELLTKFSAKSR